MHRDIIDILYSYIGYNTANRLWIVNPLIIAHLHNYKTIIYYPGHTITDHIDYYYILTRNGAEYTIYKNGKYRYVRDNMSIFYRMNKVYIQTTFRGINYRNGHKYELEYIFAIIFDIADVIILSCEYDTIYPFREDSYCYIRHTQLDIAEIIKSRYYQRNAELSRYTNIICA